MNAVTVKSAVTLTLAAAFFGHSVAADADRLDRSVGVVPSITINYAELDISKPQGLAVLYARLQQAAKSVCHVGLAPRELSREQSARTCYRQALDKAVTQVNRPTLTALHRTQRKSELG